ncbi:putative dolichyl-phosphate-mannose--protein mannosyltransferase [Corynebacterium caspium DSM 44850]|nr:putative dolichyl-phosphate-mannose--protein mannosyltransferase [Corynebacterium caspium DSM 44850]
MTKNWTRRDIFAFLFIGVLAAITRFARLSYSVDQGTPIFDEKHYVPQSWDMVQSYLPFLGGIESNPGYGLVVHPPLAKQLTAISEAVFGYTPLGWRVMVASFGVATVLMIMLLSRELSSSWKVALLAGLLATADGVLLVSSRFGMLDIYLVFFVVSAAWMVVKDRNTAPGCIRWWAIGAGVMLGLALSVKWSGAYYIIFFGILTLLWRRGFFTVFISYALIPSALYLWSWRAWFASETGVYRHALSDGTVKESSLLHMLPEAPASWLYYHFSVLKFHASLTTSSGHSHPWDSKPWSWLIASRPILYQQSGEYECSLGTCRTSLYLFGTPAIWWVTIPVLLWAIWCVAIRRDWRFIVPLVGFAAGFIPWLLAYDRQMYFFYATALVPFSIVMISLILGQIGRRKIVVAYMATVAAMFFTFAPIHYGLLIPEEYFNSIMWLPSWR